MIYIRKINLLIIYIGLYQKNKMKIYMCEKRFTNIDVLLNINTKRYILEKSIKNRTRYFRKSLC